MELIKYRVQGKGINYYSKGFTSDEIIRRRAILRQVLLNSSFNKINNDVLDAIRVTSIDSESYTVESGEGYETVIGYRIKKAPNDDRNIGKDK